MLIIYSQLSIKGINLLTFVSKGLRKSIFEDKDFWNAQSKVHFLYPLQAVTEPKSAYLSFEKNFLDKYKFEEHEEFPKCVEIPSRSELIELFIAAKTGNKIQ